MNENKIAVDDKGLQTSSKCHYIQINEEDAFKAGKLLLDNNIPMKIFDDPNKVFFEAQADSGLRATIKVSYPEENPELIAVMYRTQVGKALHENIDAVVDYKAIVEIVSEVYNQDILEDGEIDSENERYLERRREALENGRYVRKNGIVVPTDYYETDSKESV